MQSASVLIDSPVVTGKPQSQGRESSSAGSGLFDSELKQQQQQIDGKSSEGAANSTPEGIRETQSPKKASNSGSSEKPVEQARAKDSEPQSEGDPVENRSAVKGEETDAAESPEGAIVIDLQTEQSPTVQPESSRLAGVEFETSLEGGTDQKRAPQANPNPEGIEAAAGEAASDSGNKLPPEKANSGNETGAVAALESGQSADIVGAQGSDHVAGQVESHETVVVNGVVNGDSQLVGQSVADRQSGFDGGKVAEINIETVAKSVNAASQLVGESTADRQGGFDGGKVAESTIEPVAKEDVPVRHGVEIAAHLKAEGEAAHDHARVAAEGVVNASTRAEELPQVVAAPSLKGGVASPVVANSSADAATLSMASRAETSAAGQSASNPNPNSNPNSNPDSMAGRQNLANVGHVEVTSEGDGQEPADKMAAFLATLKSVSKEGAQATEVPNASTATQPGAKSQPLMQMVSSLASLQGGAAQSQTTASAASVSNGAVTSDSTPAMMTIATSMRQQGWDRAMGERLVFMARNGLQEAKIEVNPRQMGPIEIKVSVNQEQQANVSFITTNNAARETIDAAMPRLREMFDQAGLNLAESEVSQRDERQSSSGESADEDRATGAATHGVEEEQETLRSVQVGYVRPAGLDLFA